MIKVEVLIDFTDKVTGKKYEHGKVYELTAKRINEINAAGKYIKLVEDSVPTQAKTEPSTPKKENK